MIHLRNGFRVVYRFENELLLEVHNRTVHGALLMALAETEAGYRFYLGVYVCKAGWITPVYMALFPSKRSKAGHLTTMAVHFRLPRSCE